MMKKFVYAGLILLFIGIIGSAATFKLNGGILSFKTSEIHEKKVITNPAITSIEVDVSANDVQVMPAEDNRLTVEASGRINKRYEDRYKLNIRENGSKATISVSRKMPSFMVGVNLEDVNVKVHVPKKQYKMLKVQLQSGDITATGIKAETMSLHTTSGDINATNNEIGKLLKMSARSGDLTARSNTAESLQVKTTSGDLHGLDVKAKSSSFETTSGDIELANIAGNVTTETMSGDITIDNERTQGNVSARTTSGDVTMNYTENPASLAVDADTRAGDIELKLPGFMYQEKEDNRIIGKIGNGMYKVKVRVQSGDFLLK
ncbi:DUF4097 family beta strand repeat-containing protein [Priestia koreensis]|uniref:DUF4097 domain-containing protein n=2 Tax=Priestia koreensis TaxID=284581 RepID=A0A0M0KZN1_9BACI|nr:DUF4097 family beta strand repeat-containing protein [Priestia koreensis]KOO44285.1 hypothetical protein AMD01_13450 [Priestia koreensis]MCM3005172.1 DUF4097 domain-containing protein [Priestia koreensis]